MNPQNKRLSENALQLFSGKYGAAMLIHALDGPIYVTQLRWIYRFSAETFANRRRELIELELFIEKKEEEFPFRVFYELTSKGRQIAEHLRAIQQILEKKD